MSTVEAIAAAIKAKLPEAQVVVQAGSGGHFALQVSHRAFRGLGKLAAHRLVLSALAPLMAGPDAPVHAIDRLDTLSPEA